MDSFTLVRKKRMRRINLRLDREGNIKVSAPCTAAQDRIEEFVRRSAPWINRQKKKLEELKLRHPPKRFEEGETFLILGEPHALRRENETTLFLGPHPVEMVKGENILTALRRFFWKKTEERARHWIEIHSPILGVEPKGFQAAEQTSLWGSCTPKGILRFNWRLSMAPDGILEYVTAHELAHLKWRGHGKRFWTLVSRAVPDYVVRRRWLTRHGRSFFF